MTDSRPGHWRMFHDVAQRLRVGEDVADQAVALAVGHGGFQLAAPAALAATKGAGIVWRSSMPLGMSMSV